MNIIELEALREKSQRDAKKWVAYLATCGSDVERTKELTRRFMEIWLEGHQHNPDNGLPR